MQHFFSDQWEGFGGETILNGIIIGSSGLAKMLQGYLYEKLGKSNDTDALKVEMFVKNPITQRYMSMVGSALLATYNTYGSFIPVKKTHTSHDDLFMALTCQGEGKASPFSIKGENGEFYANNVLVAFLLV